MSQYAASSCNRKKRYPSERKAIDAAKFTQIKTGVEMKHYACEFCKGFHVGSVHIHSKVFRKIKKEHRYRSR
jgi:hypothetical protein